MGVAFASCDNDSNSGTGGTDISSGLKEFGISGMPNVSGTLSNSSSEDGTVEMRYTGASEADVQSVIEWLKKNGFEKGEKNTLGNTIAYKAEKTVGEKTITADVIYCKEDVSFDGVTMKAGDLSIVFEDEDAEGDDFGSGGGGGNAGGNQSAINTFNIPTNLKVQYKVTTAGILTNTHTAIKIGDDYYHEVNGFKDYFKYNGASWDYRNVTAGTIIEESKRTVQDKSQVESEVFNAMVKSLGEDYSKTGDGTVAGRPVDVYKKESGSVEISKDKETGLVLKAPGSIYNTSIEVTLFSTEVVSWEAENITFPTIESE